MFLHPSAIDITYRGVREVRPNSTAPPTSPICLDTSGCDFQVGIVCAPASFGGAYTFHHADPSSLQTPRSAPRSVDSPSARNPSALTRLHTHALRIRSWSSLDEPILFAPTVPAETMRILEDERPVLNMSERFHSRRKKRHAQGYFGLPKIGGALRQVLRHAATGIE